jgi:hypothetical protein
MTEQSDRLALSLASRRATRGRSENADQRDQERQLIKVGEEIVRRSADAFRKAIAPN